MTTRILLVDDHAVVRDGVKRMFDDQAGAVSFGEADSPNAALKLARELEWDAVVLDLSLGDRSGLEVLKDLKRMRPKLPVLILSMHSEEQYARRAFKAGASGYLTKDCSRAELTSAIQKIVQGKKYVSPALAEKFAFDLERGSDAAPHATLSDREFEVLRLIASGKTVTEIAEVLSLSDKTISTYRARILEKMDMRTNAELTHYAIQNKLVE
jgi:two-component system, NarL family, invasion response regulator UvrY